MKYQIKLVPKDKPNDDGKWYTVDLEQPLPERIKWLDLAKIFAPHIPDGYEMVQLLGGGGSGDTIPDDASKYQPAVLPAKDEALTIAAEREIWAKVAREQHRHGTAHEWELMVLLLRFYVFVVEAAEEAGGTSVSEAEARDYVRKERERQANRDKPAEPPDDGFINDYD